MSQSPPKAIESVVALLIPPARRDEVLGDLQERCRSTPQYLADALRTVPHVIASQIRRTTDPRLVIAEAFALYFGFILGGLDWLTDFTKDAIPCATPAAVALAVVLVSEAYLAPGSRTEARLALQSALAVAIACGAQALVRVHYPALALSNHSLLSGGLLATLLAWRAAAGEGLLYRRKPDHRDPPTRLAS